MNMKLLLYILTHLAALCWAGPVHVDSKDPETGVLRLPIRKQRLARKIDTRDVPVTLYNNDIQYLVDLEIGNPAQPITLSIDTGSSDIWVWGPGSCENCNGGVCEYRGAHCIHWATYNNQSTRMIQEQLKRTQP